MADRSSPTIAVMVQVRLGSTRLPRKALLPLGGTTVLEQCLIALRVVQADRFLVLTDAASADALAAPVAAGGFELFVGADDDVLDRYARAAQATDAMHVIRATGDAPLVSAPLADRIVALHCARDADLSHYINSPLGTGVEVIATRALLAADREAEHQREREHITQFLYRQPERFRIVEEPCPSRIADPRDVTIDEHDDYELVSRIYAELYRGGPIATEELVDWLRAS